jgi:hypothetical protein
MIAPMSHLDEMTRKILRLRTLGAVEELERRWDEDDDFAERYNDSRLTLPEGAELEGDYPAGVKELYLATNRARFGDVTFRGENDFYRQNAVDFEGEPIDDRERRQIGDVGEQAILLDLASGEVIVYWYTYFKYGWDDGIMIRCADVPELVDTVALGPRYRELYGPPGDQASPWWEQDPWYVYLGETGMLDH